MALVKTIDSIEKLDALFERSHTEPVVLFKHSNSCGISSHVFEMASEVEGELNVIVIQQNRDLSNEVAVRTGHTHQSPQAFVLVNGKPVYHATHYGINADAINATIAAASTAIG